MDTPRSFPFQRTYSLQAQSPMIHFQHDQSGAALRATEVKPKLDRYLRQWAGPLPEAWNMPRRQALNYQMRITAAAPHPEARRIRVEDCKAYFGNLPGKDRKDLVFRHCTLEIICFIPELLACIDAHIRDFFILQNFGARQSKGFGGFLVAGTTPQQVRTVIEGACPHFFYAQLPPGTDVKGRVRHANVVYTLLKNGTNQTRRNIRTGEYQFPDRYIKGFAMREFLPADVGSDKAFLKSRVFPDDSREHTSYSGYTFIRALLGFAGFYEFRDDVRNAGVNPKGRFNPVKVNVVHFEGTRIQDGRPVIPPESIRNNVGIRRFRSPITIKLFEDRLYFLLDDSYQDMLGQVFFFVPPRSADYENAPYLCTPDTFDPADFIRRFVAYFNANREKLGAFDDSAIGRENEFWGSRDLILQIGGQNHG